MTLMGYFNYLILLGQAWDREPVFPFSSTFVKEEVCVIMGFRYGPYVNIYSLPKVRNVHPDPENHFAILQEDIDYLEQSDREGRVLGFIHTHDPKDLLHMEPSQGDIEGLPDGMIGGIYSGGMLYLFNNKGKLSYRFLVEGISGD